VRPGEARLFLFWAISKNKIIVWLVAKKLCRFFWPFSYFWANLMYIKDMGGLKNSLEGCSLAMCGIQQVISGNDD
jgi:hypothetical protein